jgi:hypothetical protein
VDVFEQHARAVLRHAATRCTASRVAAAAAAAALRRSSRATPYQHANKRGVLQ